MSSNEYDAGPFNAFEAAGWERAAAGYHLWIGAVARHVVEPLLDAVDLRPGDHLLDVATGPGHVAGRAAERGAHVVAVDVAEAMLTLARAANPGLDFRPGDAQNLPFDDAVFDEVVGNLAILHLGRPELAMAEAARVMRPGGRTAWTVWDIPERARILGVVLDSLSEVGASIPDGVPPGPPFFRFADEDAFASLLADAGFGEISIRTIAFVQHVESSDLLWRGLSEGAVRTSALIERQAADVRQQIRAAFDRLVRDYETASGLALPVSIVLASGRR